jgi:hypothetical protein
MKTWMRRSALLGASLWAASLTSGCVLVVGEHDGFDHDSDWSASWPGDSDGARVAEDQGLARAVSSRLSSDPALAGEDITVSARGSIVTLHGRVPSLDKLQHAMAAAAGEPGVSRVVSRLTVEMEAS